MRWTVPIALAAVVFIPRAADAQFDLEVTVLVPDTFQVDESVALELYNAITEAIDNHPDYSLADIPPQTMSELQYAVGCPDDQEECLAELGPILETGYLLWGEVGSSGRAFLVELTLWDFVAREEVFHYAKAMEGDLATFQRLLPVLGRGAVYGRVGAIEIELEPSTANIEFDSQPIGGGEIVQLTRLELGPHVVRVTAEGYFDYREEIVVDLDPVSLRVELVPEQVEIGVESGRLWTWVSLGAGIALTGAGVAFGLGEQSTQDQFDQEAARTQVNLGSLDILQADGENQALMANIFIGAGTAAIVTGIILFFVEDDTVAPLGLESSEDAAAIHVHPNGVGLALDVDF
jgi:hypothetical protein